MRTLLMTHSAREARGVGQTLLPSVGTQCSRASSSERGGCGNLTAGALPAVSNGIKKFLGLLLLPIPSFFLCHCFLLATRRAANTQNFPHHHVTLLFPRFCTFSKYIYTILLPQKQPYQYFSTVQAFEKRCHNPFSSLIKDSMVYRLSFVCNMFIVAIQNPHHCEAFK